MPKNGIFSRKLFSRHLFCRNKDQQDEISWISLSDDIDRLCQAIIFGLKVDSHNTQHILVASLYIKILSSFQAIQLLLEHEMINESKTLMRSMMEAMFALVAISKDPDVANRFIEDDHTQRLKLSISYNDLPAKLQKSLKPRMSRIINSSLNGLIKPQAKKTRDISPLTVACLAKKAGLEDVYYSIFAMISGCNYLRVYELEQYWKGHAKDKSLNGLIHPDVKQSDAVYFTAIKTVFLSLNGVINTFNINVPKEYVSLIQQFRRLTKATKSSKKKSVTTTTRARQA